MKNQVQILFAVVPLLLSVGCCSVVTRTPERHPGLPFTAQYVYPGVDLDFDALSMPFRAYSGQGGCSGSAGLAVLFWPLTATFVLVDLPFSFVLDTLCLPYDLYMVTAGGKTRYGLRDTTDAREEAARKKAEYDEHREAWSKAKAAQKKPEPKPRVLANTNTFTETTTVRAFRAG